MNVSKAPHPLSLNTMEIYAYLSEFLFATLVWFYYDATGLSLSIGFIVFCLGVLLKLWSAGYQDRLTETNQFMGPYRYLRFPHETSSMLLAIGIAIAARSTFLMFLVLMVGGIGVAFEGKNVDRSRTQSDFAYLRYKVFVSSFLPSMMPYGGKSVGVGFNWRRIFSAGPIPGKLDFLIFGFLYFLWGLVFINVPNLEWLCPYLSLVVLMFFLLRVLSLRQQLRLLFRG